MTDSSSNEDSLQAMFPSMQSLDTDGRPGNDTPGLQDRQNALDAFAKLETAVRLIQEALAERPSLEVLQLDPLLRELGQGMRILALKDSELNLDGLILKHEWRVGQSFYVKAKVKDASRPAFAVLAGQDIPEGVVIAGQRFVPDLQRGQVVGLDLRITRKPLKPAWHIRAIDRE